MGIKAQELSDTLLEKAMVWVNPGTMYGPQTGEGYIRINIATQRSRLIEAMNKIKDAL
jgi:cystathionine beta-lyase